MSDFYKGKKVLITGGAGFIGSALTSELIKKGAITTIIDNLSSGMMSNVERVWTENNLKFKGNKADNGHNFILVDINQLDETIKAYQGQEIVFHLAANFGGRGYIETRPADCCDNFSINTNAIKAAHLSGVERIQFASTACIYPAELQAEYNSDYLLKEEDAYRGDWASPDLEYGWAKLVGEKTLLAYIRQFGLKGSITRYVTAYGPGENDTHAIIALIRRALDKKDPYTVWGSGDQDRDFTYLDDIVSGTLLACEKITDGTAVNLGTERRYTMKQVIDMIFKNVGWKPKKIFYDLSKPEGVKSRALSIKRTTELLGWKPKFDLEKGLKETIEWFKKENPISTETIK
jgi:UDP-glucose 4-epimerase